MGNQSELWSAPNKTGARGPPPGLSNNNKGNLGGSNAITSTATSSSTNGWIGGNLRLSELKKVKHPPTKYLSPSKSGFSRWNLKKCSICRNSDSGSWPSTWLLLKNMTAQIDGSTLRTLCMQHGPLQHFHLYLNHGIALCKYSTREEANKAQMALNNCVLGNTTICAESPCESEVQNILQHLGVPNQQQPPPQQQPQVCTVNGEGREFSNERKNNKSLCVILCLSHSHKILNNHNSHNQDNKHRLLHYRNGVHLVKTTRIVPRVSYHIFDFIWFHFRLIWLIVMLEHDKSFGATVTVTNHPPHGAHVMTSVE